MKMIEIKKGVVDSRKKRLFQYQKKMQRKGGERYEQCKTICGRRGTAD